MPQEPVSPLVAPAPQAFGSTHVTFSCEPRLDAMPALAGRTSDDRIGHVRDRTYLAWRLDNPHRRYVYLVPWNRIL
jgi:hypothetical protein